jgi:hypothetical protein
VLKKVKLRGIDKVGWLFTFTGAAYNLFQLRNLRSKFLHHCDLIAADQERAECNTARQPNRPRARLQLASGVMVKAKESGCFPRSGPFPFGPACCSPKFGVRGPGPTSGQ